jgi:hypothetical protein
VSASVGYDEEIMFRHKKSPDNLMPELGDKKII